MRIKTTLVSTNDGLALVLPQDLVDRFALKAGNTMEASAFPQGILLTVQAPGEPSQTDVAREFVREYSETFSDLAKK